MLLTSRIPDHHAKDELAQLFAYKSSTGNSAMPRKPLQNPPHRGVGMVKFVRLVGRPVRALAVGEGRWQLSRG